VDGGEGQLGLAQSDVVYLAYRRGIERNLYPHKNLRAIAVLWVNTFHVLVRRDSPFRSIEDLKGTVSASSGRGRQVSSRRGSCWRTTAWLTPTADPATDDLMPKLGAARRCSARTR
jgi:hypothetical protein